MFRPVEIVVLERALHRFELLEELRVSDEILVRGIVHEADRFGFTLRRQNPRLADALRLLYLSAFDAVRRRLGGGREVDRRDLLVFGLHDLVHRVLNVLRRVDLLELGADDVDAPRFRLLDEHLVELFVDFSALAVGGLQGERADDVTKRGSREVHDLPVDVVHVILRALDALLVGLDAVVDLRVDHRVQVVVRDDLLRVGVHHELGDVDLEHPLDERDDPVEPRIPESLVFPEPLDEPAVRRTHDPDPHEEEDHDDDAEDEEPAELKSVHWCLHY
jgi:hypothetical protein